MCGNSSPEGLDVWFVGLCSGRINHLAIRSEGIVANGQQIIVLGDPILSADNDLTGGSGIVIGIVFAVTIRIRSGIL